MNGQLDILTLISLVVAAAAIFKLRSVLGQRTDEDDSRVERIKAREREAANAGASASGGDVINLPRRDRVETANPMAESGPNDNEARIRAYPVTSESITDGLLQIVRFDRNFDPESFVTGAKRAYEMIVTAFAEGDRKALRDLLSKEVYDGFVAAIDEREARGEHIEQQFVGIRKAEITGAEVVGGIASISMKFVSELITATRDRSGIVVGGDPQKVSDVTDSWTFVRDVSSRKALDNLNWKLDETQPPN